MNHPLLKAALVLTIIGGINWGLVGAFDLNLVNALFGGMPLVERIIYILVGISALASLSFLGNRYVKDGYDNNHTGTAGTTNRIDDAQNARTNREADPRTNDRRI